MDREIERTDWNGEKFAIFVPHKNIKGQVRLYKKHNGGRMGDAYGRFTPHSSAYSLDKTIFRNGDSVVFSKDFGMKPDDHIVG